MARNRRQRGTITARYEKRYYYDGQLVSAVRSDRIIGDDHIPRIHTVEHERTVPLDCGHVAESYYELPDGRRICRACSATCPECGAILADEPSIKYNGVEMHYDCMKRLQKMEKREERFQRQRERSAKIAGIAFDYVARKWGLRR